MIRTIAAIYKNGALLPLEPLDLPDDTQLKIVIEEIDIEEVDTEEGSARTPDWSQEARAAFEEVSDHLQEVTDEQIIQAIAEARAARRNQTQDHQ